MKRKLHLLVIAVISAFAITACGGVTSESDLQAKYDEGYQTGYDTGHSEGYDEGYEVGRQDGVSDFRARQVQATEYEEFKAFLEQYQPTCVAYVGRAQCPFCSVVTDYMRTLTNLPIPTFYVSMEPYYNTEYYDLYKDELGIDYLPTFIYYKDGVPTYFMNSPVVDGYFDTAGNDRVNAYNEMARKIDNFIQGCADGDSSVNEPLKTEEDSNQME